MSTERKDKQKFNGYKVATKLKNKLYEFINGRKDVLEEKQGDFSSASL